MHVFASLTLYIGVQVHVITSSTFYINGQMHVFASLTLYSGVQVHVVDSSTFMPTLFDKNLIP
jgi:hypothetical protein